MKMKREKKDRKPEDGECREGAENKENGAEEDEERTTPARLVLSGVLFLAALCVDSFLVPPWYMTLLLYLIPYLCAGFDTLRESLAHIAGGRFFDEDFLMVTASVGAFCVGAYAEGAAVMLLFSLGEFLEDRAVGRTRRSVEALRALRPDTARLLLPDGETRLCTPGEVPVGASLIVYPGERIPLDGTVLAGSAFADTAALTGEAMPRALSAGDAVSAGFVCLDGVLTVRADKTAENSAAERILLLSGQASSRKTKTETFLARFSRVYTPTVIGAAVLLALVPSLLHLVLPQTVTQGVSVWIYRALTFLVVSCPCALVISVPLSFFCGIGAASRQGVLVKGSGYMEALSRVSIAASDKTGTLTEGRFSVSGVYPAEGVTREELIGTAVRAEAFSTHPAARCICAEFGREVDKSETERRSADTGSDGKEIAGRGVSVLLDGVRVLAGNAALLSENGVGIPATDTDAKAAVYLARKGAYLGCIVISDTLKPDAAEAIRGLRAEGVREIHLLSGDTEASANAVGAALGIESVHAALTPDEKLAFCEECKRRTDGGTLLCIGDGINDAPFLAAADVGAAMGGLGSDAALEAADVVVMDDRPSRIPAVMKTAKKTVRIARENIVFALSVKVLLLILGAFGVTGMWAAVFGDVGVTLLCVLNAARCAS